MNPYFLQITNPSDWNVPSCRVQVIKNWSGPSQEEIKCRKEDLNEVISLAQEMDKLPKQRYFNLQYDDDDPFNTSLLDDIIESVTQAHIKEEEAKMNEKLNRFKTLCSEMIECINSIQTQYVDSDGNALYPAKVQTKETTTKFPIKTIRHFIDKETNRGVTVLRHECDTHYRFWFAVALNENYSKKEGISLCQIRSISSYSHLMIEKKDEWKEIPDQLSLWLGFDIEIHPKKFAQKVARHLDVMVSI